MDKYCILSLIFNKYEPIREIKEKSPNCDYYLFTDDKTLTSKTWNIIYLPNLDTDIYSGVQKTMLTKYPLYTLIPNFKSYKYFFRIDHSIQINKSLDFVINYMDNNGYDLFCNIHPERQSFKDEYNAWIYCRHMNNIYADIFFKFAKIDDIGLIETTFVIYKNTPNVLSLLDEMHTVLSENNNNCDPNDQCYFTYLLYLNKNKLNICWGHSRINYTDCKENNSKALIMCFHGSDRPAPNQINNIASIFGRYQSTYVF